MSLIKLKDIGFGLTGKVLDITIAIPKDTYLVSFHIYNQNDIAGGSCSGIGTEYIPSADSAGFHTLFGEPIAQETDSITGKEYDIYTLIDSSDPNRIEIKVSQQDMTIISMELADAEAETCSDSKLIVPLYNLTPLRLEALNSFKRSSECNINREFVDKILQIKAIEVALCCEHYCDAAKFWKQFWTKKEVKQSKKCGCHGGVA